MITVYVYRNPETGLIVSRDSLLQAFMDAVYFKVAQIALYDDDGISVLNVDSLKKRYFKEEVFDDET